MKKILIAGLLINNENYLPYLFKCIAQSEEHNCGTYEFDYLFLTNNNDDETKELLEDQKEFYNINVINKNYDEQTMKMPRIPKFRIMREELLEEIKKKDFKYLIMIDNDIIFNGKIIEDLIHIYENSEYDLLSTNTNPTNNPFYYGHKSLIDNEGKIPFNSLKNTIEFTYKVSIPDEEDIIKVKSAFAGMYIISKESMNNKCPSYTVGCEKEECEHVIFNKNLNLGIVKNINPLWLKFNDNKSKYARAMQKISKNKSDNRDFISFFSYIFFLAFIAVLSMIYFKHKIYIGLIIASFCTMFIMNSFNEFL
jgi:hypothetical protein